MSYKRFALDESSFVFRNSFLRLSIANCWEKQFILKKQRIKAVHFINLKVLVDKLVKLGYLMNFRNSGNAS